MKAKEYSLILLAGGKSSRMGRNKAELTIDGQTFVEMLLTKAHCLRIQEVFLSGYGKEMPKAVTVTDIYQERGPLGGIHACMKQASTPYCLVLPVDVPQIPIEVLIILLEEHMKLSDKGKPLVLKHGDRRENLIGIYPRAMVEHIENLIKEHPASVHGMLEDFGHECCALEIPDWQVENINTQETYEMVLELCEKRQRKC